MIASVVLTYTVAANVPDAISPTLSTAPIQRVRGTNDLLPADELRLRSIESRLRSSFELFGYEGIQTPIIEPLELFLRKSGDEIVARMYAFSHWNRRLCLRPEHTASVMRLYVNELQGQALPLRLQYSGPEFRYERPSRGRHRQFTVLGLELIGAAGPAADAEVLHLACSGLDGLGIRRYRLVVGHLGVVLQMLDQLGLSDHAQGLILDQMEPLSRGRLRAEDVVASIVERLGGANGHTTADGLPGGELLNGNGEAHPLANLPPEQAAAVASDLMHRMSLPLEGGSRTPQEIIERLLAKANRPDPTEQVRTAVDFVLALHELAGPPEEAMPRMRALVERYGLDTTPLDEIESALSLLAAHGSTKGEANWEVDLSLARGLRYYTGLVFEVYVDTGEGEGELQVCGGGRYDDLIRALGGRDAVPACGFSFGLERLAIALGPEAPHGPTRPRVLVAPVTSEDLAASVQVASTLRATGTLVVEQDLRLRGVKNALRHADRVGAVAVVLLGSQERAEGVAVVRAMSTREERRVPLGDVASAVRALAEARD